jgi:hypothetical protein
MTNVIGTETNLPRNAWPIASAFTFRALVTTDGTATGTPVNNTGHTFQLVVRKKNGELVLSKAPQTRLTSVAGTSDAVEFDILTSDIPAGSITPQTCDWTVWRTDDPNDRPTAYGTVPIYAPAAQ